MPRNGEQGTLAPMLETPFNSVTGSPDAEQFAHLRGQIETCLTAQPPRANRLYTLTLPLPGMRLRGLAVTDFPWFHWSRPSQEDYRLGIGDVLGFHCTGQARFQVMESRLRQTLTHWDRTSPYAGAADPVLFTAFAFSPSEPMQDIWEGLPNSGLHLPEVLLQQRGVESWVSCSADPGSNPDPGALALRWLSLLRPILAGASRRLGPSGHKSELALIHDSLPRLEWDERVQQALSALQLSPLEKVVLSRTNRVQGQRQFDPARMLSSLDCLYPDSLHFACGLHGMSFVAASPERLLRKQGQSIVSDALAGTAPRAADEAEDKRLAQELQLDPKIEHEHQLVVDDIKHSLDSLCDRLQPSEPPQLLQLRGIQHLWTELSGQLKDDAGPFTAAERLHPSAAVNGSPKQAAESWLANHEGHARGWYTGAAGWIDPNGDAELAVLIRCALLRGKRAELFAGAGITLGSDPETEFRETELKLAAMREALENA